jgi:hypothetical protein
MPVLPPLPEIPDNGGGEGQPETAPETRPKEADDVDAALRELGGLMPETGTAPATQPAQPSVAPALSESGEATRPGSATADDPVGDPQPKTVKWIYVDGRWVAVPQDMETGGTEVTRAEERRAATAKAENVRPREPVTGPVTKDPFGWAELEKSDLARVIAINLPKLRNGDPRMNIVIRNNDIIQVPTLEVGEFYVMGEVLRPGVYSLTGRRVTVKMAMAAAGNLAPLAWPENSILVRRVGNNQEQIIPLDVQAIFQGEQPDVFLKPNDVLAVGTNWRSSFYAVFRNAFRMTYGFGFIYDRNFAEGVPRGLNSERFSRW